ncbi:MAG TPA: glycosyltransferase [Chlamydiales bacterium]|nr:glycosyltransferase [Chlamydiales bacterium]
MNELETTQHFFSRSVPMCASFRVSIIIPTKNSSQHISTTIENLLQQRNCKFEAIFIDAESTDRTLEIIRSYESSHFRIQSVPKSSRLFEMVNRGISMAQGEYVSMLFPGDCYLLNDAIALQMWQIAENNFPDLFYSASFIRDEWEHEYLLYRPLKRSFLSKGLMPTTIQSSWVKRTLFQRAGYFRSTLSRRGGLDFFARIVECDKVTIASEMRVYLEQKPLIRNIPFLLEHCKETFQVIYTHFGLFDAIAYLFVQEDVRQLFMRLFRRMKFAFQGK